MKLHTIQTNDTNKEQNEFYSELHWESWLKIIWYCIPRRTRPWHNQRHEPTHMLKKPATEQEAQEDRRMCPGAATR